MNQGISLKANIPTMRNTPPIRFAHLRSHDRPENHVLHINNYIELYVYVSGNHHYIVEDSLYRLQRGDIIIINPFEVHKALPLGEGMYERFYFLIDRDAFSGLYHDPLAPILAKPNGTSNRITFEEAKRETVLNRLYEISQCLADEKKDPLRALSLLLQFLDDIQLQLTQSRPVADDVAPTPRLLERILTYITENTATIQSVTEISTALGITPQYLSGYFSRHIGTPPKIYIQAKKIALAKDLLNKGADVTQACYECGFNDCSYFIRTFKKYVGMTPRTYKTKNEKNKEADTNAPPQGGRK